MVNTDVINSVFGLIDDALPEGGISDELFISYANALYKCQQNKLGDLGGLLKSGGVFHQTSDIPAIPSYLFRYLKIYSTESEPQRFFSTSGTTDVRKGFHYLASTDLYEYNAKRWASQWIPMLGGTCFAGFPSPIEAPNSSLVHMIDALFSDVVWCVADGKLNRERLAESEGESCMCLFVSHLMAETLILEGRFPRLSPDSLVVLTGGYKGQTPRLSAIQLQDAMTQVLTNGNVYYEYGMAELSSQLWSHGGQWYRPPPWMRVLAKDPATGQPVTDGREGVIAFIDLCNVYSYLAIETTDLGQVDQDGRVKLTGRLRYVEPRGCAHLVVA